MENIAKSPIPQRHKKPEHFVQNTRDLPIETVTE